MAGPVEVYVAIEHLVVLAVRPVVDPDVEVCVAVERVHRHVEVDSIGDIVR